MIPLIFPKVPQLRPPLGHSPLKNPINNLLKKRDHGSIFTARFNGLFWLIGDRWAWDYMGPPNEGNDYTWYTSGKKKLPIG